MYFIVILESRFTDVSVTIAKSGESTGLGTICVAAQNKGRNFIGIERDEGYVEVAEKRIGA